MWLAGSSYEVRGRWACPRSAGPGRCAARRDSVSAGVSTLTGCRFSRNTVRPAVPEWMTTAALSRARGSRALVPSRCA